MTIPSPQEINQWKEDAEKWNKLDSMITGGLTELKNDHEIVERLKKRIEVLTVEIDMLTEKFKTCDTDETLKLIDLRNELQKIVEGKK